MALHCFLLDAFWNLNKICQNLHNYFSNFSINLHFITCFKLFLFSFEENVCFHRCFWLWGGSDNGTTLSKVLCRLLVTGLLWMVVAFTIFFVFQLLDLVNSLFYIYFHMAKFVWFFFLPFQGTSCRPPIVSINSWSLHLNTLLRINLLQD